MMPAVELREPIRVSAQHPALPGHFPGAPVVPGVVLLDHVAAALERSASIRLARIVVVKFIVPLLPEQEAELTVTRAGRRLRFHIERQGVWIMRGEGELADD